MTGILGINPVAGQESPRNGGFLVSEARGNRSRGQGHLAVLNDSASSYLAGVVLGKQVIGSTGTFGAPASGGATCGTITLGAGIQQGVYTIVFYANSATSQFDVFAPNGAILGKGAVGSAFSIGGLGFTLTDASAHVAVDEIATITVGIGTTYARGSGDTGQGTCGTITVYANEVIGGTYTWTCVGGNNTATAVFSGVDPFGNILPNLTVGTAYTAGGLSFTITDNTHFVLGDTFTIVVTSGNNLYYPVSATAYDGTQNAASILLMQQYVGGATTLLVAIIERDAEVVADRLVWPSTLTDNQQRNWISQLKALGIIVRGDLV